MPQFSAGTWWFDEASSYALLQAANIHSNGTTTSGSAHPKEIWAVRRWIAETTGLVRITGVLRKANGSPLSNGVVARMFVGSNEVWFAFIEGTDTIGLTFEVITTVIAGASVDFALDPHLSHDWADDTVFTILIEKM